MGKRIEQEEGLLQVKMFGNFSIAFQGKSLLGKKVGETQFTTLMQILLHNKNEGVSREFLEEALFRERDVENTHHALQSVVYNAKKKLECAGLPKVKYITLEKGYFYWTPKIPVKVDALEFEELCRVAEKTKDPDRKLKLLLEACYYYTGEFLSAYTGVIWAAFEARRYRAMFCRCVEQAAAILRERRDYQELKRLGLYATSVEEFSDWETLTMEALVGLGQYEEATKLYSRTVDLYFFEKGLRPSQKLMDSLKHLGGQVEHPHEPLAEIQERLNFDQQCTRGGYLCSFPIFQGIYHMVVQLMKRSGRTVYLMICTIVDSKGNPMKDGRRLKDLSDRLGDVICGSVRQGDVINRYGKGQYLVLLVNITYEDCRVVQKRITSRFQVDRQRIGVQYQVSSIGEDE